MLCSWRRRFKAFSILSYCCGYVEGRTRTEHIGDLLWHRLRFLGHYMVLEQVHFEDLVRTILWSDVILQATNARRAIIASASTGVGALEARLRIVLARNSQAGKFLFGA